MPLTTPFHAVLSRYNKTGIWKHWAGYLVAPRYQYSTITEYYAIRNGVSILDTSPLFKYRFSGADSQKLLEHLFARDIRKCKVGRAQYTVFCDENGFLLQDGVVLRTGPQEFWFSAAEPALRHFKKLAEQLELNQVQIEDVSRDYGILAIQGPLAFDVLGQLAAGVEDLSYFGVMETDSAGVPLIVSRTGYTGDLGYEVWVKRDQAESFLERLLETGAGYNLTPIGTTAMKMARVEAGLQLMGVDFDSAKFAWCDEQKISPFEMGFGWMFRGLAKDDRAFVGREEVAHELTNQTSRWNTVGLEIDVKQFERLHLEAGVLPQKHETYVESTMSVYRQSNDEWDYAGYVSSFLYSSLLKKPIAIAKLPPDLCKVGTTVELEVTVLRRPHTVEAKVVPMPFFNPERKTAQVSSRFATEVKNAQ